MKIKYIYKRYFKSKSLHSFVELGPHDKIIYDIIVGSLLGKTFLEKRLKSIRIFFYHDSLNLEYLYFLYKEMYKRDYLSDIKPFLVKYINNIQYFNYKSFSFVTFDYIYKLFYNHNKKKQIPINFDTILSPRIFAIWLMTNGFDFYRSYRTSNYIIISSSPFSPIDTNYLKNSLKIKFNLNIKKIRTDIYFFKCEYKKLYNIIKPFIIPYINNKN